MSRFLPFILLYACFLPADAAGKKEQTDLISEKLTRSGFENVRVCRRGDTLSVSIEDPVFRWNVDGIRAALDTIAAYATAEDQVLLYVLVKDIPRIVVKANAEEWDKAPEIEYVEYGLTGELKAVFPLNPSVNKIDFVLYPQFALQNTLLSQIYEIQLNIAPAVEVSLWKGMLFTGQVIFPLKNDLGYEGDFIRPGFVTLAQEFCAPHRWFGRFVIGNFNANRYGADFTVNHPLTDYGWEFGMNAGLTGSSYFYDGQWITSEIDQLTWFVRTRYYYPKYNLQLDLSYGRYIHSDYGFRADCTRHFGATTIGFYAMHTGGELNGGFHFSVPLPPGKRNRRHALRVIPPSFFDWEYNAGTEFYYGRYYETRPNENRTEHWINPGFIKNEILNSVEE